MFYCDKPNCVDKKRPIKPSIVFFNEPLPIGFYNSIPGILQEADICFIMGTALAVAPVNKLPQMLRPDIPKVLFNLNNTKETGGYDFEEKTNFKLFV